MGLIFFVLAIVFLVLWNKEKKNRTAAEATNSELTSQLQHTTSEKDHLQEELSAVQKRVADLSRYDGLVEVDDEIEKKKAQCDTEIEEKKARCDAEISEAKQAAAHQIESDQIAANAALLVAKDDAKAMREKAKTVLDAAQTKADYQIRTASDHSKKLIADAEAKAKEIAGEAYEIAGKAKELEQTVTAMKNIINGYGTQYLKPTYALLDELAADFGHTEAGQKLKDARENSSRMVRANLAAVCDYVETNRKTTAIAFVVDAFNGKVDSILTKTKKDNYGTLEQRIKDAFQLVNHNGTAFRNARITPEYLEARLEELKWGTIVSELKAQAQEEQRRIREQMREEERARREYEKAMKDAAKEEEMLRKAMEKAQQQIATATEAKKAEFEAKLADLQKKLEEAEERGKRALSMAQQTKHGNVYVISNVGSFGENVYKVGMTRRLEPLDRVKELGDASVPFPFDVHAIIETDDAPALETNLHKALSLMQMNKVNPRKEFFKVQLADIRALVEKAGLKANWTIEAAATEYKETLAIEEEMRNDPEAKKKWEEFAASIAAADSSESE